MLFKSPSTLNFWDSQLGHFCHSWQSRALASQDGLHLVEFISCTSSPTYCHFSRSSYLGFFHPSLPAAALFNAMSSSGFISLGQCRSKSRIAYYHLGKIPIFFRPWSKHCNLARAYHCFQTLNSSQNTDPVMNLLATLIYLGFLLERVLCTPPDLSNHWNSGLNRKMILVQLSKTESTYKINW